MSDGRAWIWRGSCGGRDVDVDLVAAVASAPHSGSQEDAERRSAGVSTAATRQRLSNASFASFMMCSSITVGAVGAQADGVLQEGLVVLRL